jgi:hypothetical protein
MKRLALIALVTAAVLAITAAVGVAAGPHDSVKGQGLTLSPSSNHFGFSAHSGPSGEDTQGEGHVHDNTTKDGSLKGRFGGPISCLRVAGNRAVFKIVFRTARNQFGREAVVIFVEDNGDVPGRESLDRIRIRNTSPDSNCPDPLSQPADGHLEGDITVNDAIG